MDTRSRWIPRIVRGATLLFALGLLLGLWVLTSPQAASAQGSPSGRGQTDLDGPMGVNVGAYQGSLSLARTDLPFECSDCGLSLSFSLLYDGQENWTRNPIGFYGWRHRFDVYLIDESFLIKGQGRRVVRWGGGATTNFYPNMDGTFRTDPGENDTLTEPQPGQYVLTTCSGLTYYFDSDRHSRPTRIEARNGQALILSYDADGELASIRDSYGRQIQFSYDAEGYLTQVTDPNVTPSRTVHYGHDADGNLTEVADALGNSTLYSYDAKHRLTEIRDASGHALHIVYNAEGRVASLVTAGAARHFAYDTAAQKTTVTDMVSGTASQRTVYRYDDGGRILEVVRNDGLKRTFARDDEDNPVRVTDESGQVTTYTYDDKNNITSITDPLSRTVRFTYHPVFNEMTSSTDALGRMTTIEYDATGNVVRVTRPGNRVTTYEYDTQGWHVLAITEPMSRTTRYGYDACGNNTVITDATGAVMTYVYDAAGRMTSFTDDNGHSMEVGYDATGRPTSVTDGLSRTISFAYDASENLQQVTDAAGGIRSYRYDDLNQLTGITDEIGGGITYGYDGVGNPLSVADAHGHTVHYGYDELNLLASETDPVGNRTTFEYDALGQLERRQDADGQVATYEYDVAGQISAAHYPEGSATFAYDATGNVVAITTTQAISTSPVIMRYTYNDADEVTSVTAVLPGLGISKTIGYTYYDDGSRATMTDPDGVVTTYTYDGRGRIETISNPAGVVTYTWDGAGRLTRKDLGNGTYVLYDYDEAGQLLSMVHYQAGGAVLDSLEYTYDDLGNRTSEVHGDGRAVTYTYDARSRLVAASYSDGTTIEYAYDLAGHRTQMIVDGEAINYTSDPAGRLQSDGSTTYGWDRQGNLSSMAGVSGTITYTFDYRHRLTEVVSPGGETITFGYYPDGRRLSRTDPEGMVTLYLYDGPNLLLELNDTGETLARYTSGFMDDWLSMERDGERYTYHADALGSVLGLSDAGGNLVEGYRYTPFGRTQVLDGAGQPLADSKVGNPFRFTGRQSLGLGELYDYRARIYDPAIGRFLSEDPVDAARDPNRYAYALNNPTTLIDPSGKDTWVGAGAGMAASFGFGCSRWSGWVRNQSSLEKCSITEWCCGLGGQAQLEVQAGVKAFNGPREGSRLGYSKWTAEAGFSAELGAAQAGAEVEVNTSSGDWETYFKSSAGAYGLGKTSAISNQGNVGLDVGFKLGVGFKAFGRGQYCKRTVEWCEKEEEKEKEDDEPEEGECGSDTGCCWIGPSCGDEPEESECCYLCCGDGPCDQPDCGPNDPFFPPDGPGNDHPDDNFSAAALSLSAAAPLDRSEPYVGLLWRGHATTTGVMINQAGEAYEPVGLSFSPELARRLPVLVIPSGGLYGLEDMASLQARLASYVELGGTIISFDQQQGADFQVLPAGSGGDRLGGYGWREDNSCFESAFYISNYHPVVSGFDKPTLTVHVDGYFSTLPSQATELLNRMKNGQPGLVLYPYPASGQGGYVLASTVYDDWGTGYFQVTPDAMTLVRDMLSWAYEPDESLSEYSPGDPISLDVPVTNGTSDHAASIELALLRPDRTTAYSQILLMSLTPGGSVPAPLDWTLPGDAQLGIWWVEYRLYDASGSILQPRAVGSRFVISDPSPSTGPNRPLSLSITAPAQRYISGTEGEFTFHVYNHTDTARSVVIRYGLPHHTWELNDPSYGNFGNLEQMLSVGPAAEATFVYRPIIFTTDRLWATLVEDGYEIDKAHFAVFGAPPSVQVTPETDENLYLAGEEVVLTANVKNQGAAVEVESSVEVRDPNDGLLFSDTFTSSLVTLGTASQPFTFTLPQEPVWGFYTAVVQSYHGELIGKGTTRFEVPGARLRLHPLRLGVYNPAISNDVDFALENVGNLDVSNGVFTTTVYGPTGVQVWSDTQPFAVGHGQITTLTVPVYFSNEFGVHRLRYQAGYGGQRVQDEVEIPFGNKAQLGVDQMRYCGGETMGVEVGITNRGRFHEELGIVRLEVPEAGYAESHSVGLLVPGETVTDTHFVPLPAGLGAGTFPLTATLELSSGSQEPWSSTFFSPPPKLAASVSATAEAGQVFAVTITNVECGVTSATYDFSVGKEAVVQTASGTVSGLAPGVGQPVTITLPAGATSGAYSVVGVFTETQTGVQTRVYEPLEVSGQSALLEVQTEQKVNLTGDPIRTAATITSTGTPLTGATLRQQIWAAGGAEQWITLHKGDTGLVYDAITCMAIDASGLKWIGAYETSSGSTLSALDDNGTPFDETDDTWLHFGSEDGMGSGVDVVAIDADGYKWVAWSDVSVLDDGGTPFDKSDDQWQIFTTSDGMPSGGFRDIAIDATTGFKWFATTVGLAVLDDKGTPLDKIGDEWRLFTTANGLPSNSLGSVTIDEAGRKWIGSGSGVTVLDDGGDPFDGSGDQWMTFTAADGALISDYVNSVAVDGGGRKWIGTQYGVSVLDDGGDPFDGTGDQWVTFRTSDGLINEWVRDIAIDGTGGKWFGSAMGSVSFLDDKGTPFDKNDDQWVTFFEADGVPAPSVDHVVLEEPNLRWIATYQGLGLLDDGGTPLDKTDDQWRTLDRGDSLLSNWVRDMFIDIGGYKWFGTGEGVSVLDDGGTIFDGTGDRWTAFTTDDGLSNQSTTAMATDAAGRKWFASSNSDPWGSYYFLDVLDDGGTPFDKSDDTWGTFTDGDGPYRGTEVMAVDAAGRKWMASNFGVVVLDDGGTPFDKSDDTWQIFTTEEDPLTDYSINAIALDGQGRAWIATSQGYKGLNVLDIGGTLMDKTDDQWHAFTTADGLFNGSLYSLAIDAAGRIWIGGGNGYGYSFVSVLDYGSDPFDGTGDQWVTFTQADGLGNRYVFGIAIDALGRKWFAKAGIGEGAGVVMLDDGGTPFDKTDDDWRSFSMADGLASDNLYGVVVDPQDRKWFYSSDGGVSVLGTDVQVLWESTAPANPVGVTQIGTEVGPLNATGKLHLRGVLTSTTGQVVASDDYGFYIFDTETSLTLETDSRIYRPGQTIALSGEVRNESGATLTDQTLAITQDGGEPFYTEGPFNVDPYTSHFFNTTTSAPGSPGSTRFVATVGTVQVEDEVQVAAPQVTAALEAPDLAGSRPFTVTVVLTNSGELEASVYVDINGAGESVVIPVGDTHLVQRAVQIFEDTTLSAVLSGDLNQTLSHPVVFGEAAEVAFIPELVSCPGLLEVPYVLSNTGQLEVEFTTQVSVTSPSNPSIYRQIEAYLPPGGTKAGALALELVAGDWTLSWQHPYGTGQETLAAVEADQVALQASAGPSDGHQAPVTVTLTNVGCNPFDGTLAVAAETAAGPFTSDGQPVALALGASGVYTFGLEALGLPAGVYTATLTLLDGGGDVVNTAQAGGDVDGPELRVSALPVETTLVASQTVTLTFDIENAGAAGDQANLTFTLDDLEDETQVAWLDAGTSGTFTYTFFVPPDLVSGDLYATYVLTGSLDPGGDSGDLVFPVEGISLTVDSGADQLAYREGDPALVTLSVANTGSIDTGPLEAMVSFNGVTQTQTFELAPGTGVALDFPLVASFKGDAKVFYGVYFAGTDRAIHLDTLYLRQEQPLVTLLPDKQVYQPGETVVATLVTTLTQGTLSVFAPGYDTTLDIENGAQVIFDLPFPMARGTEAIYYVADGTGTAEDGRERSAPFDVDGPEVFVRSSALRDGQPAPGGAATLELVVTSDRPVDLVLQSYILYPGGIAGQMQSQPVHLEAVANNRLVVTLPLTSTQVGQHQFRYQMVQPATTGDLARSAGGADLLLLKSSVGFDTGPAGIVRVITDQAYYANTDDPVQARLEIYSRSGGPAQITLGLDDGPVTSLGPTLSAGYQALTVTLDGPIPPGQRRLTAILTAEGQPAQAQTGFDYGTSLPDLRPSAPWVAEGGIVTRTVTALVSNEGQSAAPATDVHFYDGGSEIGTAAIPALDAAEQGTASIAWYILGKGGEHTLRVTVDPVGEFDTSNNEAQATITLPRLDSEVTVTPAHLGAGGTVAVSVWLQNLQEAAQLPVTATVEVRSPLGAVVHEQAWSQTLGGAETKQLQTSWETGAGAVLGTYSILQEAWDLYGERYLNRSSFTLGVASTKYVYLPVVLRDFGP